MQPNFFSAILISVAATQETKIKELREERNRANARITQLEERIASLGGDLPDYS